MDSVNLLVGFVTGLGSAWAMAAPGPIVVERASRRPPAAVYRPVRAMDFSPDRRIIVVSK